MVDEIHWIYKFPGVQFGLDPVTAGDTIHLNQKKNYHPFVVRTKSIHQNKTKKKNKRKGNIPLRKTHKKKYSDRKKKTSTLFYQSKHISTSHGTFRFLLTRFSAARAVTWRKFAETDGISHHIQAKFVGQSSKKRLLEILGEFQFHGWPAKNHGG